MPCLMRIIGNNSCDINTFYLNKLIHEADWEAPEFLQLLKKDVKLCIYCLLVLGSCSIHVLEIAQISGDLNVILH